MKENLTEIVAILDMSGSMDSLQNDTIGGYNSLIEKNKELDGDANITLVLFDHEYMKIYDNVPISEVKPLDGTTYSPRGMTALYDAIGRTVDDVGKRLAETDESERPSKIMVAVITDGYENSSKEYTQTKVKQMITHQQDYYNWEFVFLGANIDATQEGTSLGFKYDKTMNFASNSTGVNNSYNALYAASVSVRSKNTDYSLKDYEETES